MKEMDDLLNTYARLLGSGGCPWDLKQTMKTIRCDLLEECYELLQAISLDDNEAMLEELGDLFCVMVFLGKLAEKEERFSFHEVLRLANDKMIRRHPHVFGETEISTEEELLEQWNRIKLAEKGKEGRKSVWDGIPTDLPALARAQKIQKKIGSWSAIHTEEKSKDPELELGEELWALVSKAHALKLDAEQALRRFLATKEREFRACELCPQQVES